MSTLHTSRTRRTRAGILSSLPASLLPCLCFLIPTPAETEVGLSHCKQTTRAGSNPYTFCISHTA